MTLTQEERASLEHLRHLMDSLPAAVASTAGTNEDPFAHVGPDDDEPVIRRGQLVERPEEVARVIQGIDAALNTGAVKIGRTLLSLVAGTLFPMLRGGVG